MTTKSLVRSISVMTRKKPCLDSEIWRELHSPPLGRTTQHSKEACSAFRLPISPTTKHILRSCSDRERRELNICLRKSGNRSREGAQHRSHRRHHIAQPPSCRSSGDLSTCPSGQNLTKLGQLFPPGRSTNIQGEADESRPLLEKIASQVKPIMTKRSWTVGTLAEVS